MSNPYNKILISKKMQKCVAGVKRVDEQGSLYCMECDADYYGTISWPIKALGLVKKGGCSAFISKTPEGDYITGRNYDMPHKDDKDNVFGVDMVLKCMPEGKYRSIAGVDTVWLSSLGIKMSPGCLDDGTTGITGLALMPYLCMDGMNEKGFSVSILALDIKNGEKAVAQNVKGKKKVIITMLVRYMLDSCANVEEAIALAKSYNLTNTFGADYHLFVTDSEGNSAALEWRNNQFRAVYTNAITNCYVGYDDAEDCYYPDGLKEKWVPLDITPKREYHFGYGHGYERYKKLIRFLDSHIDPASENCSSLMTPEEGQQLLGSVAQNYNGMLTSFTQYSVIYNNTKLTAYYWMFQDYEKKYSFNM